MRTAEESFNSAVAAAREWAEGRELNDPWAGSKNEWFRIMSSKRKGATGERIIAGLFAGLGYDIQAPGTHRFDRHIDGWKVEIKTSTEWADSGGFKFSQLRDLGDEIVVLLGIRPESEVIWAVPKAVVWAQAVSQHAGVDGVDTRWLAVDPDNVPAWLRPYGGTTSEGAASFAAIAAGRTPHQPAPTHLTPAQQTPSSSKSAHMQSSLFDEN